ncbi:MAG: cytochrome c5 family protein [Desulfuromonadales bacterium]|nr:cytochrome c5 family protein [Desulfuromonadales bacterium]MBN2791467.1 cytochrome c5 family protein [Desulfuromonadales bacterium]
MKQSQYISGVGLSLVFLSLALFSPSLAQSLQKEVSPNFSADTAYKKSCSSCHDHGVMGAPKPGDQRFSKDIDSLVKNAIKGIGNMPARGHASFLSDDEVRSIVEYMEHAQE